MLKVWGRASSINVQKVMWAVSELRLVHERIDAGGAFGKTDTPEFGRLNPNRLVPVLDDEGFVLWESAAIIRYLARTYGSGTLLPLDAKDAARADQWMEWAGTSLYPDLIATVFIGLVRTSAAERNQSAIEAAARRVGERLAVLDGELASRDYILGNTFTVADIPAGALMYRYYTLPIERPKLPNVEAWYQRLAAREAYAKHVAIDYSSLKVPGA
jgi:glutathione S-transferase